MENRTEPAAGERKKPMTGKSSTGPRDCFAFEVWVYDRRDFNRVVNARSAGKAKSQYLRKVGAARTSESFMRNAAYRGMPYVECGNRVLVGNARGVIVGHNSSANFDVLFDDDSPKYPGLTLNVHPSEVTLVSST